MLPGDHPLACSDDPVKLGELGEIDLIGYRVCRAHAQVEQHLRSKGIEPRVVFRAEDNSLLQRLVAAGIGAAIMPLLAVDSHLEAVEVRDLSGVLPDRRIGLVFHGDRYRAPAQRAFVELALDHAARLAEQLSFGMLHAQR